MSKLNHKNIMKLYGSSGGRYSPEGLFMFLDLC